MRSRAGMQELVVREIVPQTSSIVSLTLEHPSGQDLPAWEPGAHIDVQLLTRHERQYSLCGDPADRSAYRIAVLREERSRGASHYIHSYLRPGARVFTREPRNHFALADSVSYLLLAAGIGITPVMAMARELAARESEWRMVYLVRERSDAAFASELAGFGDRVRVHAATEDGRLDIAALCADLPAGTDLYACGPPRLMDDLERHAPTLPAGSRLHVERFAPVRREFAPDVAFTVVCARSETTVDVPAGSSMLLALSKSGIEVPSSCMSGVCGTCAVPMLAGSAEHRDSLGADDARGIVYPCVSRAQGGQLTLDL